MTLIKFTIVIIFIGILYKGIVKPQTIVFYNILISITGAFLGFLLFFFVFGNLGIPLNEIALFSVAFSIIFLIIFNSSFVLEIISKYINVNDTLQEVNSAKDSRKPKSVKALTENFWVNKIIAPIFVAVVSGTILYFITGSFSISGVGGSAISLITIVFNN